MGKIIEQPSRNNYGDTEEKEHAGVPELRQSSRYNQDTAAITAKFSIGVDVITVIAETIPNGVIDHEVMALIDQFSWQMRNLPGVKSTLALTDVAKTKVVSSGELFREIKPCWLNQFRR